MIVSRVGNPREWDKWPEAEAYLEPARARGGFATVLDDDEVLFAVMDGDELLAAATAWLSKDGFVEVKLVGGRDHTRWLAALNDVIGSEARAAGATRIIAIGRRGWAKSLKLLGWEKLQPVEDHWLFQREI